MDVQGNVLKRSGDHDKDDDEGGAASALVQSPGDGNMANVTKSGHSTLKGPKRFHFDIPVLSTGVSVDAEIGGIPETGRRFN